MIRCKNTDWVTEGEEMFKNSRGLLEPEAHPFLRRS